MIPTPHDMPDWAQLLAEISLQAAILAIVVALVIWAFGRVITPAWRFALWGLVLARFCLPVTPTSDMSMFALLPKWDATETRDADTTPGKKADHGTQEPTTTDGESNQGTLPTNAVETPLAGDDASPSATPFHDTGESHPNTGTHRTEDPVPIDTETSASSPTFLYPMLLAVWLSGVAMLCVRRIAKALRLSRMIRKWQVCADEHITGLLDKCREGLSIRRSVQLMTADAAVGPATIGWLRPRIVLPMGLLEESAPSDLEMILLHELGHVRRSDALWHGIAQLVTAVHWFNPVAWLVRSQLVRERELACDGTVLNTSVLQDTNPARTDADRMRSYGELLIRMAARGSTESLPAPAIVPALKGQHKRQLTRRIEMIASHGSRRSSRLLGGLVLACLAVTGLTVQAEPGDNAATLPEGQPGAVAAPRAERSPADSQAGSPAASNELANQDVSQQNKTQPDAAQQNANAQAVEEPAEQLPYIIVPVTTPLQQLLMRGEDAVRFVLVDGDSLVSEDGMTLDFTNFNLDRFGRAVNKDLPAGSQVAMRIHYYRGHPEMSRNIRRAPMALGKVLRSMITQYGDIKEPNGGAAIGSSRNFADDVQTLQQPEPAGLNEDPIQNEFGTAYPVRTNLSQMLTWNDRIDCVIHVNPKYDLNPEKEIPPELLAGLKVLTSNVELDQRRYVLLKHSASSHGNPTAGGIEWFEQMKKIQERNAFWAKELGFESATNSVSSYKEEDNQTP